MSKLIKTLNPDSSNVVQLFDASGHVIKTSAPVDALNAEFPYSQVSNRYNQVKTIEVVRALESDNWEVAKYKEASTRDPNKRGFQKHFVWMRPKGGQNQINVGDTEMRLLLTNSHDGSSAFRLQAGLHRMVCSNGLVVSMGDFQYISIRHTNEEIEQEAIDSAYKIAAMAPKINNIISKLQDLEISPSMQLSFARDAAAIVWDKNPDYVNVSELVRERRNSDKGDSLWSVYNRVQENLVRGGLSVIGSRRRTRGINSPVRDVEVNKALFELAVKYAA